jgi:hypothetical protein
MKIKPQPPRLCLGWFAWVFGILLVLFAINYAIDMIRLANAWNEAYTLATQLGYTPERHLTDRAPSDINIVPVFGDCKVKIFFTTPLSPTDFAARLQQSVAPLRNGSPTNGRNMYLQLPFVVDGSNTKRLSRDQIEKLPPVYEHYWLVKDEVGPSRMTIFYAELSQAKAKIEYNGRPITENVVYISVDAGRFPLWVWINKC